MAARMKGGPRLFNPRPSRRARSDRSARAAPRTRAPGRALRSPSAPQTSPAVRLPSIADNTRACAALIGSARSGKACARLIRTAGLGEQTLTDDEGPWQAQGDVAQPVLALECDRLALRGDRRDRRRSRAGGWSPATAPPQHAAGEGAARRDAARAACWRSPRTEADRKPAHTSARTRGRIVQASHGAGERCRCDRPGGEAHRQGRRPVLEVLRPARRGGDRVIGGEGADRGAKRAQLLVVCANPEQAASASCRRPRGHRSHRP